MYKFFILFVHLLTSTWVDSILRLHLNIYKYTNIWDPALLFSWIYPEFCWLIWHFCSWFSWRKKQQLFCHPTVSLVCPCPWGCTRVFVKYTLDMGPPLAFSEPPLRRVLSVNLQLSGFWLNWWPVIPNTLPVLSSDLAGVTGALHTHFIWMLRIWTQVLTLAQKVFLPTEPSPQSQVMSILSNHKGL